MIPEEHQMALDAEYARVEAIDAGIDVLHQIAAGGALKAVVDQARDDAVTAMSALVQADPEDPKRIRQLQWKVTRYDALCSWIATIIENGRAASEDLTAEQSASLAIQLRGEDSIED